jgi:hypothetical protein
LDFLMGDEAYLRKRRISVSSREVGATNRPENIVIRYVSFVSDSSILSFEFSLVRADISKVAAHERIQHL